MKVAFRTHPGVERKRNEDTVLIDESIGLFIVADGMGGHRFGDTASRMAVDYIHEYLLQKSSGDMRTVITSDLPEKILFDAFDTAHTAIIEFARQNAGGQIIGTTCTAFWHQGEVAIACHIGDSLLFRYHQGSLEQLTTEHTLVQELVDMGRLTPEEAHESPYASILNKVLGLEAKYGPEIITVDITEGSVLLLCSDGLTKAVPTADLSTMLDAFPEQPLDRIADRMLESALSNGGPDNISLIIIDFTTQPEFK